MPWPEWLRGSKTSNEAGSSDKSRSWNESMNRTDWSQYTSPEVITMSVVFTGASFGLYRLYRLHLRRIPNANYLTPDRLGKKSLYGYVTRVGDGDNFHLFHTPGGRLAGWGWLPGRQPAKLRKFQKKTIHVRIAGIDAPEMAHFGRPAQPHSQEALDWLTSTVLHKHVRAFPYRRDQYDRVVCTVYQRKWGIFKSDVGLNMLRQGLATVYEAKFGSEFGGPEREKLYRETEAKAKSRKVGMWQEPSFVGRILGRKSQPLESPREYKTRMQKEDLAQ